MMILNEFDAYRNALKKIDLSEPALPIYKGRILTENIEIYGKIQRILNCRPMEQCHRWLYDLDVENLDESECNRVNNLFKLGIEKGYIDDDFEDEDDIDINDDPVNSDIVLPITDPAPVMPSSIPTVSRQDIGPSTDVAYTVLYSAMKDGDIKTGESYSNSINTRSAKADVINKLERAGYQNISILAIEAGDPDMAGQCDNTFNRQTDHDEYALEDDAELEEADKDDTDNDDTEDTSDDKEEKSDDDSKDDSKEDSKEEKTDDTSEDDKKSDDKDDDSEEEDDSEEDEEKSDDDDKEDEDNDKLTDQEKVQLKNAYKKAFRAAMLKCKFDKKSFDDLTLEEKVTFFTEISKSWKKEEPLEFMSDKELEQLEKIVINK